MSRSKKRKKEKVVPAAPEPIVQFGMTGKQLTKWNNDVISYFRDNEWIEVEQASEHFVEITRIRDGAVLRFWPATSKARKIAPGLSPLFQITDLDNYLEKNFKDGN